MLIIENEKSFVVKIIDVEWIFNRICISKKDSLIKYCVSFMHYLECEILYGVFGGICLSSITFFMTS